MEERRQSRKGEDGLGQYITDGLGVTKGVYHMYRIAAL